MGKKSQVIKNVNWEKYFDPSNKVLNAYLKNYGDNFLIDVLLTIEYAVTENLPMVVLIEFTELDIVSMVKKSEYPLVLYKLLKLCEHLEKYEICEMVYETQKRFYGEKRVTSKGLNERTPTIIIAYDE